MPWSEPSGVRPSVAPLPGPADCGIAGHVCEDTNCKMRQRKDSGTVPAGTGRRRAASQKDGADPSLEVSRNASSGAKRVS